MDTLPAICVSPEGTECWINLIECMIGYNVTVVTDEGLTFNGQIFGTRHETGGVVFKLGNVDADWEPTIGLKSFLLEELTGIVVH